MSPEEERDRIDKKIAHVAIVDETGSEEYFELLSSSILAALQALDDNSWFALVTFSNRIGLYDLLSDIPHVQVGSVVT